MGFPEDPLNQVRQALSNVRMSSLKGLPVQRRAQIIQAAQEMFNAEDIKAKLDSLGLGPDVAQMFDTANTAEGLQREDDFKEQRRLEEQANIAKFVPMSYVPGMEERVVQPAIQGVQDMAAGYGIGEGGGAAGEKALPFVRGGAQLVSGIAPYAVGTGGLGAIPGIAGALGKATGPAIFSATFGGLEAARQLGTQGKISDPKALATEAVVGVASGLPVGRLAATTAVAGAHGLFGTFSEDPTRAAIDTAFTALFGNPKYAKKPVTDADYGVLDVGGERAAGEIGPPRSDLRTPGQQRASEGAWANRQAREAYGASTVADEGIENILTPESYQPSKGFRKFEPPPENLTPQQRRAYAEHQKNKALARSAGMPSPVSAEALKSPEPYHPSAGQRKFEPIPKNLTPQQRRAQAQAQKNRALRGSTPTQLDTLIERAWAEKDPIKRAELQQRAIDTKNAIDKKTKPEDIENPILARSVEAELDGQAVARSNTGQEAPLDNPLEIKNRTQTPDRVPTMAHPERLMWHKEAQQKIKHAWDGIKNSRHLLIDRRVAMHLLDDYDMRLSKLHTRLENALSKGGIEREVIDEALDMARRKFTGKETQVEAQAKLLDIEEQWNKDVRHQQSLNYTPDQARPEALMSPDAVSKSLEKLPNNFGFTHRLSQLLHAEFAQGPTSRNYRSRRTHSGTRKVDFPGDVEQVWKNEYEAIAKEIDYVTNKMLEQLDVDTPVKFENEYQAKIATERMLDELTVLEEIQVKGSITQKPSYKPVKIRTAMKVAELESIRNSIPEHLEQYGDMVRQLVDERIARIKGNKKPGLTQNKPPEEGGLAQDTARTDKILQRNGDVVEDAVLSTREKYLKETSSPDMLDTLEVEFQAFRKGYPGRGADAKQKSIGLFNDTFKELKRRGVKLDEDILGKADAMGAGETSSLVGPEPPAKPTTPQTSAGPETTRFFELQKKANEYGLKLDRAKGTYTLKIGGKTQRFRNVREAEKALIKLDGGLPDTPMLLEAAAAKDGTSVEFTGTEYKTHNFITGEQIFHKSFEDARVHVAGKSGAGDFGSIGPPTGKSIPGIGHPGPASGHTGVPVPNDMLRVGAGFFDSMKTAKTLIDKISDATGWNANSTVFRGLMDANRARMAWSVPLGKKLRRALKGVPRDQHQSMMDVLIAVDRPKEARLRDLNKHEVKAVSKLDQWFQEMLEVDKKGLNSFYDTVRLTRKYDGNMEVGTPGNIIPAWASDYLEELQVGDLALHDKNVLTVAHQMLYSKGFKSHMSEATKTARKMRNKMAGEGLKLGANSVRGKNLLASVDILDNFIDGMSTGVHHSAEAVAQTINQIQRFFVQRGVLKQAEAWNKRDVHRLSMEMTSWFSGSAMTLRPALAIRNLFQWMLGIPKVGYGTAWQALKRAASAEGQAEFRKTNIVTDPSAFGVLDDLTMIGESSGASKNPLFAALQELRKVQSAGMFMYRFADTANRAIAYHQGKLAIEKYAPMLANKKISMNEFLLRTGLMGESTSARFNVLKEFVDTPHSGQKAGIARAADLYGKEMVEQSQFVYSGANAPRYSQHMIGRFFGQFGLWPTAFSEYMWKNAGGLSGMVKPGAQGQYHRSFVTKYATQLALLTWLGEETGVQMNTFNRANPLTFEGGPIGQMIRDSWTLAMQSENEYDRTRAKRNLYRTFKELLQPFGGVTRDQVDAMDERDLYQKAMNALGFNMQEG